MESLTSLFEALQSSGLATALRLSGLAYPLVNGAHIIGIALLFGGIAALDIRLIGFFPSLPLAPLARLLVPVAAIGFVLAITTGALLFATRAPEYAALPIFWLKLALVVAATVNALLLHRAPAWPRALSLPGGPLPLRVATAGGLSILLWLSALLCGRLIAYFT
jgi:hypothetical protein